MNDNSSQLKSIKPNLLPTVLVKGKSYNAGLSVGTFEYQTFGYACFCCIFTGIWFEVRVHDTEISEYIK